MWHVLGRGEMCTGFWWGDLRERDHWVDPGVDGRIILKYTLKIVERVIWIELALDSDRWLAVVNAVMKLQ
jgi:hypothetical protein